MRKLLRYATVSAVATSVSLSILGVLVATGATSPGWANIIATAVGTVASFELNRRWVWGKRGRRSARAEVGPYAALSLSGLALSTLALRGATGAAAAAGWALRAQTVVAEAANVGAFGALWLAQFALADRVLFRGARRGAVEALPAQARDEGSHLAAPAA